MATTKESVQAPRWQRRLPVPEKPMRLPAIAALLVSSCAVSAAATVQQLAPIPATQVVTAGDLATMTVMYDSEDHTVTGVGVRVHYDGLRLTLESISGLYPNKSVGAGESAEDSSSDSDGDPDTDRVFNAAWADISGEWPGEDVALPMPLFTLSFRTRPGYISTDLHLTTSTCAACTPQASGATIQIIGHGPTFTPTSTPSITGTPTPLPTPTFGPSPTPSGPGSPPSGGPPPPTATVPFVAVPAASGTSLFFLAVALAVVGVIASLRQRD
jgi:hypothetical protein